MIKNNDPLKLCSVCSMDNDKPCGYHGSLRCNYREKIKHRQISLS